MSILNNTSLMGRQFQHKLHNYVYFIRELQKGGQIYGKKIKETNSLSSLLGFV